MTKFVTLCACTLVIGLICHKSWSATGVSSGGGGDELVLDFVAVANQQIYPWLKNNGQTLRPRINARDFLAAVDPKEMASVDHVYESCKVKIVNEGRQGQHLEGIPRDGTDREVQACYDGKGHTYLSRTLYPLHDQSQVKRGIVAHEVFRRMGVEGDNYAVSKQMAILTISSDPAVAALRQSFEGAKVSVPGKTISEIFKTNQWWHCSNTEATSGESEATENSIKFSSRRARKVKVSARGWIWSLRETTPGYNNNQPYSVYRTARILGDGSLIVEQSLLRAEWPGFRDKVYPSDVIKDAFVASYAFCPVNEVSSSKPADEGDGDTTSARQPQTFTESCLAGPSEYVGLDRCDATSSFGAVAHQCSATKARIDCETAGFQSCEEIGTTYNWTFQQATMCNATTVFIGKN